MNLAFIPVFKPHTQKLNILKHCTNVATPICYLEEIVIISALV